MSDRILHAVRCPLEPSSVRGFAARLAAALDGGPALLPLQDGPERLTAELRPELGIDEQTAVVIGTSGSTGAPKGVTLTAPALRHSARATHDRLGGPGHWLLALPVHHIAGLQVLVRAAEADTALSIVDATHGFTARAFADAAAELPAGRRYTALVPTQLVTLLDAGGPTLELAAGFDAVLVGGAACPDSLLDRARAAGLSPVTTYGMSETAGGCLYDGRPLAGVRVQLRDSAVLLGGPTLAAGYLRRPDLTAAAFDGGWFHTRDVGRWSTDGRLEVLGRSDDMVVTGGEKVAPTLVERALCSVPSVRDACVVAVPDARWGQAVAAAVVASGALDETALRDAVRTDVGLHAVPKIMSVVDSLPTLASGKVDRTAVAALLTR